MSFPTEADRLKAAADFVLLGTHQPTPPYHWLEDISSAPGASYFRDAEAIGFVEIVSANSFNAYSWNAGEKETLGAYGDPESAKAAIEQRVNDLLA